MADSYQKKAKYGVTPSNKKRATNTIDPDNYLKKTPVWLFHKCDKDHDRWSLCKCNLLWDTVLEKLAMHENRTWSDIISQSNGNNHYIEVENLCTEAKNRLNEMKLSLDTLFSLRLTGGSRVFGFREDNIFIIIWFDPNHEICPSIKRHT